MKILVISIIGYFILFLISFLFIFGANMNKPEELRKLEDEEQEKYLKEKQKEKTKDGK